MLHCHIHVVPIASYLKSDAIQFTMYNVHVPSAVDLFDRLLSIRYMYKYAYASWKSPSFAWQYSVLGLKWPEGGPSNKNNKQFDFSTSYI